MVIQYQKIFFSQILYLYLGQLNITLTPSGISVIEYGDTINISCISNSNIEVDEVIYTWTFNENVTNNNSSVLTIEYNSAESVTQGGLYQCFGSSRDMILSGASNQILIAFAPLLITTPKSFLSNSGDMVVFNCTAVGHPLPVVEWYRLENNIDVSGLSDVYNNMIELPESSVNSTMSSTFEEAATLTIHPVDYNDYGYYICVAKLSNESLVLARSCCDSTESSDSTNIDEYYEISNTSTLTGMNINNVDKESTF